MISAQAGLWSIILDMFLSITQTNVLIQNEPCPEICVIGLKSYASYFLLLSQTQIQESLLFHIILVENLCPPHWTLCPVHWKLTSSSLKTYVLLLTFHCRGNKIINVITLLLLFPDTTSIFAFTSAHSTPCTGKQSLKAFFNRWWLYVTRTLPMEG